MNFDEIMRILDTLYRPSTVTADDVMAEMARRRRKSYPGAIDTTCVEVMDESRGLPS